MEICVLYPLLLAAIFTTGVLSTRLCSRTVPVHSSTVPVPVHSTTRHRATQRQVETHLGLVLPVDSPVCLVTEEGVLVAVVTVLPSTVLYPVTEQYQYTDPHIHLSCYCQCSYSPCQLRQCPLCYTFSTISPGCRSSPSTTCCSARLSTPNPTFTALKLGLPSLGVRYRLEQFCPVSGVQVRSAEHVVQVRPFLY